MTDVPSSKILTEEEASLRDLRSEASYLEKYGFHYPDENYVFRSRPGLDAQIVAEISHIKGEPAWMLELRLKALKEFERRPMPTWGGDLSGIKFDEIYYYVRATEKGTADWSEVPDDIKETFDRLGIPEAERQFLAGAGAQYECLAAGTKVYTSRGAVPIEEIREGDIVFAYDEQAEKLIPAPVKATMAKGKRQVYEVKVGTRTIRATDNHPFLTLSYERQEGKRRGHYQRTWKYLHEIKAGDLVAVAKALPEVGESHTLELPVIKQEDKYRYNEVNLPEETSEDLMWLFGLYMGDGYVHRQKRKAQVAFAIPESDPQLQAEVKEATKRLFGLEARRGDAFRLVIGSTIVADYFEMNGFEGNSHTKRVPHWVYSLPLNQRLAFLGGYLDSDGYVRDHAKNHDVMYTSANAALLEDVRQLTLSCSLPASNIHHFASPHVHDKTRMVDGYRLLVSGDTQKIPARSERRRERLGKKKYTHNYSSAGNTCFRVHTNKYLGYVRVTSITPVGEAEVYDIEVDGPHNFVAEGLIVHNSEMVYHKVQEHLEKQGVIFLSMDDGLRQHPELVKEYFGSIIPYTDNKFAALNTAVWSGGSFIYVPKGVHVEMPLQAYFRINTESMGQFERTLIIVDEGGHIHYVEGCTAPVYSKNSLHSAVVEIIVKKGGKCRYTTIQNWSNNVYNLVTKRAVAYADATMEWVDANLGCLCKESTVTTPQGIKTIEAVEVGDQVLSYDEKEGKLVFRKVMAKRYSGEQPVHTISVGERKLRATANHPFYSYTYNPDAPRKSGRYQLSYVRADQLQQVILPRTSVDYGVPYRLIKPVLTTTFESFNQYASNLTMTRTQAGRLTDVEYTTDDLMWLFGYWMGDGTIQFKEAKTEGVTRWAKVGFSTPRTDRARPQLMKVMGEIIEAEPTERANGVHLAWNSKELAEFFRLNGFYGKATDKRVPEWVWSLPESQRLAFIAGYLDADGTMQANQFCAKSVNKALLEDMASLLVTLGITPRLHTEFSEPKTVMIMGYECVAHGSHRLDFRVDERFFPYLSSSLRERAAQSTAQKQLVLGRHIGRSSIELGDDVEVATVKVSEASAEPVPTWDIEVEGTGNFVSEGFIVHNSHLTMKYPAVHMMEPGAHGEILSIAFAGKGQHQDAGGKVVHHAPNTTSRIISKSISKDGGRASYRGLLKVDKNATGVRSNVVCDALLLDPASRSDTYPYIEVDEQDVTIGHEASVSKIGEEQLFYLMSRGLNEDQANAMIVNGFIEPLAKELPMEYSMELRKLIDIQLEGTIG